MIKPSSLPASPVWLGAAGFSALSLLIVLYLAFSSDPALKIKAVKSGQLHQIDLTSGEIIGMDRTKKAVVEEKAEVELKGEAKAEKKSEEMVKDHEKKTKPHKQEGAQKKHHDTHAEEKYSEGAAHDKPHGEVKKPASIVDEMLKETAAEMAKDMPDGKHVKGLVKKAAVAKPFVNAKLLEKTEQGELPKAADKLSPAKAYAKKADVTSGEIPIAVLVVDVGLRQALLDELLEMPAAIAAGVSPYSKHTNMAAKQLYAKGHELWLGLPMQREDYPASDPGPYGILLEGESEERLNRLHMAMASMQGYVGLYGGAKEVVSNDEPKLKPLLHDIVSRGLYFMFGNRDSGAAKDQTLISDPDLMVASQHVGRNILMAAELEKRFTLAEQRAKKKGGYLVMVEASPLTLRALKRWAPTLKSRGFALVPPSQLYRMDFEG